MNKFIRVASGQCSAKQMLSSRTHEETRLYTEYSGINLCQKHQFLNIYDRKANIQGTFQVYQIGENACMVRGSFVHLIFN